jgi:hypothetical protein
MPTKVTVNLPEATVDAIKEMAERRGITQTEAIRQAIDTQHYIDSEVQKGREILLQNPDNKTVQRLVFNPSVRNTSKR